MALHMSPLQNIEMTIRFCSILFLLSTVNTVWTKRTTIYYNVIVIKFTASSWHSALHFTRLPATQFGIFYESTHVLGQPKPTFFLNSVLFLWFWNSNSILNKKWKLTSSFSYTEYNIMYLFVLPEYYYKKNRNEQGSFV